MSTAILQLIHYKLQSLSLCLIWISGREDPLNEFLDEDQKTKSRFQSCSDSILHVARTPMRRCGWSSKRGSHLSKFRRYEIWKENLLTVSPNIKTTFLMTQSHDRKHFKEVLLSTTCWEASANKSSSRINHATGQTAKQSVFSVWNSRRKKQITESLLQPSSSLRYSVNPNYSF